MSEISLRSYIDYIEDRLARDAYTEAIAQCRHILERYPKYMELYRVLGRALLGQENYQDALDIFQRILSTDPNDFVSHIGISDCYHESGALEQAIWHLERAYEQAPDNLDLQEALKQLYQERDGSAPRKVQLTPGALARLYARGNLYQQAVLELRKALQADSGRLDLQVLLAEMLWNNHQPVEAGKVAAEILAQLPYSVDANRILAKLWLKADRPGEAQPFIKRVRQLDPYLGYELTHRGERPPADSFQLAMLDYSTARHVDDVGAADWVSEIGSLAQEQEVTPSAAQTAEPIKGILDIYGEEEPPEPSPTEEVETPDWLQQTLSTSPMGQDIAQKQGEETSSAIDLDQLFAEKAPPAEEAGTAPSESVEDPDWLSEVLTEPEASAEAPDASAPTEIVEEIPSGDEPDWLAEIGITPSAPSSEVGPLGAADEETPDWLAEITGEAAPSQTPEPSEESVIEDDSPDWLAEITGEQPAAQTSTAEVSSASEAAAAPPAEEDGTPDWLADALSAPSSIPESAEMPEPTRHLDAGKQQDAPEWLDDILSGKADTLDLSEEVESAEETAAPEVVSDDWLDDFLGISEEEKSGAGTEFVDEIPVEPSSSPLPDAVVELPPPADIADGELETWNAAVERASQILSASPSPEPPVAEEPATLEAETDFTDDIEAISQLDSSASELEWLDNVFVEQDETLETPPVDAEPTEAADEPASSETADEAPDWLTSVVTETDAEDEEASAEENFPDWLDDAETNSAPSSEVDTDVAEVDNDVPDWLSESLFETEESDTVDEEKTSDEDDDVPDWLKDVGLE